MYIYRHFVFCMQKNSICFYVCILKKFHLLLLPCELCAAQHQVLRWMLCVNVLTAPLGRPFQTDALCHVVTVPEWRPQQTDALFLRGGLLSVGQERRTSSRMMFFLSNWGFPHTLSSSFLSRLEVVLWLCPEEPCDFSVSIPVLFGSKQCTS